MLKTSIFLFKYDPLPLSPILYLQRNSSTSDHLSISSGLFHSSFFDFVENSLFLESVSLISVILSLSIFQPSFKLPLWLLFFPAIPLSFSVC